LGDYFSLSILNVLSSRLKIFRNSFDCCVVFKMAYNVLRVYAVRDLEV